MDGKIDATQDVGRIDDVADASIRGERIWWCGHAPNAIRGGATRIVIAADRLRDADNGSLNAEGKKRDNCGEQCRPGSLVCIHGIGLSDELLLLASKGAAER